MLPIDERRRVVAPRPAVHVSATPPPPARNVHPVQPTHAAAAAVDRTLANEVREPVHAGQAHAPALSQAGRFFAGVRSEPRSDFELALHAQRGERIAVLPPVDGPTRHETRRERERRFALAEANKIRRPEDFAIVLLEYMGLPVNKKNVVALLEWESTEGGHWRNPQTPKYGGYHNPLNTDYLYAGKRGQLKTPGATRPNPRFTPAAQYPSWKLGVEATAFTLREHQFAPELKVLRRSEGGAALRAAVRSTPTYGTIASRWTTKPIGIYAYSNYTKSPFFDSK